MKKMDKDTEKAAAKHMEQMAGELQKKESSFNIWKCLYGACKKERVYGNFCENHKRVARNITQRRYQRQKAGWS